MGNYPAWLVGKQSPNGEDCVQSESECSCRAGTRQVPPLWGQPPCPLHSHTGDHVNKHPTQSGVLQELGCHDRGTHCLKRLFILSCRDIMTIHGLHSPCRLLMISTNPGRIHEDLCSGSHIITSWGGVAGSSLLSVVAVWSLLWAADRDPLGWACVLWLQLWLQLQWGSARAGSDSQGEVTSTQLKGAGLIRTSLSVTRDSFTNWISNTLSAQWWGSPGISSLAFSTQYWRSLT